MKKWKRVVVFIIHDEKKEEIFKLGLCCARDLFVLQIPVTSGGFELRIYFKQFSYITHQTIVG